MADSWEPATRRTLCGVQRTGDELWFFGEIDESNADNLASRATAEIRAGATCLNLSQVWFFAAAGRRIVLAAQSSAPSRDGGIRVVCSPEAMRALRLGQLAGLDGLRLTAAPEATDHRHTARP
jgi:anti-anti-sigma regulatory factor